MNFNLSKNSQIVFKQTSLVLNLTRLRFGTVCIFTILVQCNMLLSVKL